MTVVSKELNQLEDPDISLAGLAIWIHGYEFPDSGDYWDGNWLKSTARCNTDGGGRHLGANVVSSGPFIRNTELQTWCTQLEKLDATLKGEAALDCMELNLQVTVKSEGTGQILMEVEITPDHMLERHWFAFEIDQTYLKPLISQINQALNAYPVKNSTSN